MLKKIGFIACWLCQVWTATAQETWSLERCIAHAQQNNRSIKQGQIQVKNAKLGEKQARLSVYPSVNAGSNLGFNFGRSVNPATYQFENFNTVYNGVNLQANATLYNGGRISNQIKQGGIDVKAAEADLEQVAQNTALQVAQAYLQILLNEEQLDNARRRVATTKAQLDRTEKQIRSGALPPTVRLDIVAQLARDEQTVVINQNNVDLSYLSLKNLLELAPEIDMRIERPAANMLPTDNTDAYSFRGIYNQALGNQAQIRAAEWRIKSAEVAVLVAKSQLLPSLGISGSLSTNYSNAIRELRNAQVSIVETTAPVRIDGQIKNVGFFRESVTGEQVQKPYGTQFSDNFGQGFGLNLSIPIFNGLSRKISVERSRLDVENQILALERTKQQLRSDVQNAIASAKAAKKQYEAAVKTYDALKAAFDAVEKRLQVGAANGFEYTQARNNLDSAERDVVVAKYDFLFKTKIVNFYEGKRLTMK